jgi:hypothetical protein
MQRLCLCLEKCNLTKQEDELLEELLQRLDQGASVPSPAERQEMLYRLIGFFESKKDYKRKKTVVEALLTMSESDFGPNAPETIRAKNLK